MRASEKIKGALIYIALLGLCLIVVLFITFRKDVNCSPSVVNAANHTDIDVSLAPDRPNEDRDTEDKQPVSCKTKTTDTEDKQPVSCKTKTTDTEDKQPVSCKTKTTTT